MAELGVARKAGEINRSCGSSGHRRVGSIRGNGGIGVRPPRPVVLSAHLAASTEPSEIRVIHDMVTSTVTFRPARSPFWRSGSARCGPRLRPDITSFESSASCVRGHSAHFRASCRPALETARKALRLECDHRSDRSRERDERPVDRCEIRSSRKTRCKPLLLIIDDLVLQAGDRQLFATIFGLA